jgi:hypothetical protein
MDLRSQAGKDFLMEVFILVYMDLDDMTIVGAYTTMQRASDAMQKAKEDRINNYRHWWLHDRPTNISLPLPKLDDATMMEEALSKLRRSLDESYFIQWMVMDI